ncbi:MAG: hypothetical protein AAGB00_01900 [Planctomycetota bacterium]
MSFLVTYYGDPNKLKADLVRILRWRRRWKWMSTGEVEQRSGLREGLLDRVEKDSRLLTTDLFLDVCGVLDLPIEDAMPIKPSPAEIERACEIMRSQYVGMRASSGDPGCDNWRPVANVEEQAEASKNAEACTEVPYPDQAPLFIRLQILDELDQASEEQASAKL